MARHLSRRLLPAAGVVFALVALEVRDTQAHKGITSFYNFNKDVYPIFLTVATGSIRPTQSALPAKVPEGAKSYGVTQAVNRRYAVLPTVACLGPHHIGRTRLDV